ncbi:hypothetical protein [Candidatus Palauibacter sp.]|uniref:hypothetical protein n=1 Tax=Candidatus Palauibacter sp. TaxID=3101350 RepID=UPI003B596197
MTVTARDPGGLETAQRFSVTVTRANRGPETVSTIPDPTLTAGQAAMVDVTGYFRDPDGDALTYTARSSASAVASVSVSGRMLTIVGVARGSATVTLIF